MLANAEYYFGGTLPPPFVYVSEGKAEFQLGAIATCADKKSFALKVLAYLSIQKIEKLTRQFDKLMQLKDGWCGGIGVAPDKSKVEIVAKKIISSYPEHLPLPIIVPTLDGNLLMEWHAKGNPITDIDLGSMMAHFHIFGLNDDDIENDFDLNNDFKSFVAFLSNHPQLNACDKDATESIYSIAAASYSDSVMGRSASYSDQEVARELAN